MPLPGGAADKYGNRYEGYWTVLKIIEVLEEIYDSITIEEPGEENNGFEFYMQKGEVSEYYQIKRQNTLGKWTINSVNSERILNNFKTKFEDNKNSICVFASGHAAFQIEELSDRAIHSNSYDEFIKYFLSSGSLVDNFSQLKNCWGNIDSETCYNFLKRFNINIINEGMLVSIVLSKVQPIISGEPNLIKDTLANLALNSIHKTLTAYDIWNYLEENSFSRRSWDNDPHIIDEVEKVNNDYFSSIKEKFISNKSIPRDEVKEIVEQFEGFGGKRCVLVTGDAGCGKSNALFQSIQEINGKKWPFLAFRIDELQPVFTIDDLGKPLGLSGSPAAILKALSKGNKSVLIIDQLDAVSMVSGRNTEFFVLQEHLKLGTSYLSEVENIIKNEKNRFHIKSIVFLLFSQFKDPSNEELKIILPYLETENLFFDHVWHIILSSPSWFEIIDKQGFLEKWLSGDNDKIIDTLVWVFNGLKNDCSNRIAELLYQHIGKSEKWNSRFLYLMQFGKFDKGEKFLELFLQLIREGYMDNARGPIAVNSDFWDLIYSLPDTHPDRACKVIGCYLNRRMQLCETKGEENPFTSTIPDTNDAKTFYNTAKKAPQEYISQVLPFMLKVIEKNIYRIEDENNERVQDSVWGFGLGTYNHGIQNIILNGMVVAMEELVISHPFEFSELAEELKKSHYETVQYILIKAYTKNGSKFAEDALKYVCESILIYKSGYLSDMHWLIRELLKAVTPYCYDRSLRTVEEIILNYYTKWEKSKEGHKSIGKSQLVLLEGIDKKRISRKAYLRILEWKRKFDDNIPKPPKGVEWKRVESPISDKRVKFMNNKHWLDAIDKYNKDTDFRGGARELSQILYDETKKSPERFANLGLLLPDNTYPYYFNSILRGLRDTDAPMEIVLALCNKCHNLPNRPCGAEICDCIAKLAEYELPEWSLDIVSWYAINDSDPEKEIWREQAPGGNFYYGGDIITYSINTVRGRAAEALGCLIFPDISRLHFYNDVIHTIVKDASIAVRASIANTLISVLKHNRDLAVQLFLNYAAPKMNY